MNRTFAIGILVLATGCAAAPPEVAIPGKIEERSSSPPAVLPKTYAERVRARIRPNLVFMEVAPDNTFSEVEVRCTPDGKIVSAKVVRSSGLEAWDRATLRAIERSEYLPRDINGETPSIVTLVFEFK